MALFKFYHWDFKKKCERKWIFLYTDICLKNWTFSFPIICTYFVVFFFLSGFRYELYCITKACKTPQCVVIKRLVATNHSEQSYINSCSHLLVKIYTTVQKVFPHLFILMSVFKDNKHLGTGMSLLFCRKLQLMLQLDMMYHIL